MTGACARWPAPSDAEALGLLPTTNSNGTVTDTLCGVPSACATCNATEPLPQGVREVVHEVGVIPASAARCVRACTLLRGSGVAAMIAGSNDDDDIDDIDGAWCAWASDGTCSGDAPLNVSAASAARLDAVAGAARWRRLGGVVDAVAVVHDAAGGGAIIGV